MKKTIALAAGSTYTKLPIYPTIVWWLFLDRLDSPGWVWGSTGAVMVIIWVASIYAICTTRYVHIRNDLTLGEKQ